MLVSILKSIYAHTSHHLVFVFIFQSPQDAPYHRIMRATHVVKGAAANLMCGQLRSAAMALEDSAKLAHESGGMTAPLPLQQTVQAHVGQLQIAAQNFVGFLQSIGIG
jgi:HPt (histidine-containing phosphotransfer) domain-containing protein